MIRLWVHEVSRVFSDRLTSNEDQSALFDKLRAATRQTIREDLIATLRADYGAMAGEPSIMQNGILFTDISAGAGHLDEVPLKQRDSLQ